MKRLIEILNDNVSMRLNKLDFSRKDAALDESMELYIDDGFKISEVDEKMFSIAVTRHIYCIPECLMDINLEFEIARYIDDEIDMTLADFNLEEEITENNIDEFIDGNFNRASALISNVTASYGMSPLITPPIYLINDNLE